MGGDSLPVSLGAQDQQQQEDARNVSPTHGCTRQPSAELSFEALVKLHASHQEASKRYLPLLYGNSESLVTLQLADTEMTDVAVMSLCDALKGNTACTEADLSRNYIGTEGCRALSTMLAVNTSLQTLKLGGNHIGDDGANLLLRALENNRTLTAIDLGASRIGMVTKSLASAVTIMVQLNSRPPVLKQTLLDIRADNLTVVDLSREVSFRDLDAPQGVVIDDWCACRLAEALSGCATAEVLRLCYQHVGDEGAVALATMLHKNQRLDVIDLFANSVSDVGVAALRNAIASNNCITVVNVGANSASDDAIRDLECALVLNRQPLFLKKYLPKLHDNDPDVCCLELDEHHSCRHYDDLSARLLRDAIAHNTHVTSINLSNNKVTAIGARFLADALETNTGLRMLNLNHNQIGSEGAAHLADALRKNQTLMALKLSNNGIDDIGGEVLAKALEGAQALTQLDLSFNPELREAGHHFVRASQKTRQLKELVLKGTSVSKTVLRQVYGTKAVASEPPALRAVIAGLHREDPAMRSVDLGGVQDEFRLADPSCSVLGTIVGESQILTSLNLSNNDITNKGMRYLMEGLLENRHVMKSLNLSGNPGLDYETARMFTTILAVHRGLTSLDLSNCALLDAGGQLLYDFFKAQEVNCTLTQLDVSRNKMRPDLETSILSLVESHKGLLVMKRTFVDILEHKYPPGRLILDRVQDVTDPDIPERVINNAARVVSLVLAPSDRYNFVSFRGNKITDDGVAYFVDLLAKNENFTGIDLSDNPISNEGVGQLVDCVTKHPRVRDVIINVSKRVSQDALDRLHYVQQYNQQPGTLKTLLETIDQNDPSYTAVDCNQLAPANRVDDAQLQYITQSLVRNQHIQTLNLAHNHITNAGAIDLAKALRECFGVTSLSLQNNVIDSAEVGKVYAELLMDNPSRRQLSRLDLSHNELDDRAARYLLEALEVNDNLTELNFTGNPVSASTLFALECAAKLNCELEVKRILPQVRNNAPNVTTIDFSGRNTNDVTVYTTCRALERNTHVTSLDLSNNKLITDAALVNHLSVLLTENEVPIKSLCLARTGITEIGACAVLEALETNTHLQVLSFKGTSLAPGKPVVETAERAFEVNTTFLNLVLEETGLSEEMVQRLHSRNLNGQPLLRESLPLLEVNDKNLTVLDLSGSGYHTNTTCYLLAKKLYYNETLTELNLSNSRAIDDKGAGFLANCLHQNITLRSLAFNSCNIGDVGACGLASALQVNRALTSLDLANNHIGNEGCNAFIRALRADVYGNDYLKYLSLKNNQSIREDLNTDLAIQLLLNRELSVKYDLEKVRVNSVSVLDYSGTSFGDDALGLLLKEMETNKSVTTMRAVNCKLTHDGGDHLARFLYGNTTLTELNIRGNAIGVAASALVKALQTNATLLKLDVMDNECTSYDVDRVEHLVELNHYPPALKQSILRSLDKDPTQTAVVICGAPSGEEASQAQPLNDAGVALLADALKTDIGAQHINLSWNAITAAGVRSLCAMLRINHSIETLDLSHNLMDDDAALALSEVLAAHKSISTVLLSHNKITAKGVAALSETLEQNYLIKTLDMNENDVPGTMLSTARLLQDLNHKAKAFCSLMQKIAMCRTDISEVNLGGWLGLGNYDGKSLHLISEAIALNPSVTSLDLAFCDVSDDQIPILAEMVTNAPHLTTLKLPNNLFGIDIAPLMEVLATNKTLTALDLRDNHITLQGAKSIAAMLRENDALRELDISGNEMTETGIKIITEALKMNDSLEALYAEASGISKQMLQALEYALDMSYKNVDVARRKSVQAAGDTAAAAAAAAMFTTADHAGGDADAEPPTG